MNRKRLKNRRENQTVDVEFGYKKFAVTIGFDGASKPKEVFTSSAKTGSDLDHLLADACVVLSLYLQNGGLACELSDAMGRFENGEPASLIGALADLVATEDKT